MINKDLFHLLSEAPSYLKPLFAKYKSAITPETIACRFLGEGYAMEYYPMPDGSNRVTWFWGKGEFIIPTSPYSDIVTLEGIKIGHFKYGPLLRKLREHEDARVQYKAVRDLHNKQIAERINDIKTLSPLENYIKLLERKPWVFQYASNEDIASYLNISVNTLDGFRNKNA